MKTIHLLIVVLFVVVLLLAGCNVDTDTVVHQSSIQSNNVTQDILQYKDFEFPEETDKLVLYNFHIAGYRFGTEIPLMAAVEIFKRKYPDERSGNHELRARRLSEPDADGDPRGTGTGSDVQFLDDLPDIEKTMSARVFVDLNPYIANDDEFDMDNYIGRVAEVGQYDGHQYCRPPSGSFSATICFPISGEKALSRSAMTNW